MRVEFNSSGIEVSYIIEFLKNHSFPSYHILTDNPVANVNYIKDYNVVKLDSKGNTKNVAYNPLNATRKFIIKSTSYTSYTHKFLGDFLRYFRDTTNIDLMPLYNCYANEVLDIESSKYKYYIVPVKAGKTYTVSVNVEDSFNIYLEQSGVTKLTNKLITVPGSNKVKPFTFKVPLKSDNINYVLLDNRLNAIFEIPKTSNSSFTVLEGSYEWGASQGLSVAKIFKEFDKYDINANMIPTRLSLLDISDNETHPMSNRLVEYLIGSVITPVDEIQYNVARLQDKAFYNTTFKGTYDIFDSALRKQLYDLATDEDNINKNPKKQLYCDTFVDELYYGDKDIVTMLNEVSDNAM